MPVTVVDVGRVPVFMSDRLVPVRVTVTGNARVLGLRVEMGVMRVRVVVAVLVLHRFVRVPVPVIFPQQQDAPGDHERDRQQERQVQLFAEDG